MKAILSDIRVFNRILDRNCTGEKGENVHPMSLIQTDVERYFLFTSTLIVMLHN